MTRIERCLSQIQAIRSVETGVEPPYVARSRIGRLTMSTADLVAQAAGIPAPALPGPIQLRDDVSGKIRALASCCNRIVELARHIAQPSEPLDQRWKRGWKDLLQELQTLERHLLNLREECRDTKHGHEATERRWMAE